MATQLLRRLLLDDLMLSVVIPTIAGREDSLRRTVEAYNATLVGTQYELIVIQDAPSWPKACNAGYRKAKGDVIHFTADDLVPVRNWHPEALGRLAAFDELPAPVVLNHSEDGPWDNFMDGSDRQITHFTRVPIMTRSQAERIGPWPDIYYAADVWVSERARSIGIETRMVHSYQFVHHWEQIGRNDGPEVQTAANAALAQLRAEGLKRCD